MRQPIDVGIQAANAVAQALGQHRDDAVGKINTVAAALRLAIERAARVAHRRDSLRYERRGASRRLDFFDVDGVVEIARVVWIDRDDELAAQILATRRWRRRSPFRELRAASSRTARRKLGRQMVFPDDR